MLDHKEIEKEIRHSIQSKINSILQDDTVLALVNQLVSAITEEKINLIINSHLNNIIQKGKLEKELDFKYQEKITATIQQEIKQKAGYEIGKIDLATAFGKQLNEIINNRLKAAALPEKSINHKHINWEGFALSADAISDGTIANFSSIGIQDAAKNIQLTIADNLVIVENSLVARNIEVKDQLFSDKLIANDIIVKNNLILNENVNKQFVSLIKTTFNNEFKNKKIDLVENPILCNGKEALTDNTLGPSIINSNLRKLGRLSELNVSGIAQFNDTLLITNTGKIGINTSEPNGALTIWDDDSELTIKKYKKKNMFIGSTRDTDLSFGINNDVKMVIRKDGTIELNQIEIGGLKISAGKSIPCHHGKPGEIILMLDCEEDQPWAYRCVGGDRWKAIK